MNSYAKVIVKGSPITKSNFKLSNIMIDMHCMKSKLLTKQEFKILMLF